MIPVPILAVAWFVPLIIVAAIAVVAVGAYLLYKAAAGDGSDGGNGKTDPLDGACKDADKESGDPVKGEKSKDCKGKTPTGKLVSVTVVANAKATDVAKNWACVKKATDDVVVEAKTDPDTPDTWKQIKWSGDSGDPVPDKPNRRKLPRSASKKYHVVAELGGMTDQLDVWVLWATVEIRTTGTTPANAVQFGAKYDATENLGARVFNGGNEARGKVVPVATITPAGVNGVVKSGWAFRRERMTHDWDDGVKSSPGNGKTDYWNTAWVDDTSFAEYQKLIPDGDDKIFDRDAPNITGFGKKTSETYNNFRQWAEWGGETCSDKAEWYWRGRWEKAKAPQVTLKDVGTGSRALPDDPSFSP